MIQNKLLIAVLVLLLALLIVFFWILWIQERTKVINILQGVLS